MSSSGPSFGSNNPFRRKSAFVNPAASSGSSFGTDGSQPSPTTTARPPFTTFKSAVPEDERRDEEEQPVQQKPKKIVKRVRVQSPPPSSPEDAVPVTRFPTLEQLDDDDDDDSASDSSQSNDQTEDPFDAESLDPDTKLASESPLPQIPPNPFARTLQDIEGGSQGQDANAAATTAATSASKGSLDVDSFKRLLLTGYANLPKPVTPAADSAGNPPSLGTLPDGASATDASSISKQSVLDALHDTPRTSHEISESEAEERKGVLPSSPLATIPSASARKKPPPPSSRHGKLIKIELGADSNFRSAKPALSPGGPHTTSLPGATPRTASFESGITLHSPQATTNINKPLPAPPVRASADEDVESPFDREAAGKVPEAFAALQAHPRPPTPPPTTRSRSASQTSTQSRSKPAAPPPRRHARSDSKIPSNHATNTEEDPPRSSMESNWSRTDSIRVTANFDKNFHAPAPPPPRRPGHTRQASSFANASHGAPSPAISPGLSEQDRSPWGSGLTPMASPGNQLGPSYGSSTASTGLNGQSKISPPPPPPTRKQSTRRPPSVRSMESSNGPASVRRVSREKDGGAAPPPPPPPRARGSTRPNPDASVLDEEGGRKGSVGSISVGNGSATPTAAESGKQGNEILADLDALQREVNEMMSKAAN
ncbi:hypothetical protein F5X98DRAFT_95435 [Xylaria grammica]|nr:hypothetical protein F5X98DRAFT_95435 [Xylaria grammica]